MVMMTIFYRQALAGCRFIFRSPSQKSLFHLIKKDSTLAESNTSNINAHSKSLFELFATTKLNVSSADIVRIFKYAPHLERLQTLHKVEQFVRMMNKYGCNQHQIASIMSKYPSLVTTDAERVVEPKIQLLKDCGFEGKNLSKILTMCPSVMGMSFDHVLLPNMAFLKTVFQSQNLVIKALLRAPRILSYNLDNILKPSLAFWEGYGFCGVELAKFLLANPNLLRYSSFTPAQVDFILKIGVEKGSTTYRLLLRIVAASRMETLKARMYNLQHCGLSSEETWELFRVCPFIFTFSMVKVRENMDFVVNNMELPANAVVKHTCLLRMSLEKRIKPRVAVWQKMKSMKGFGRFKLKSLNTILQMPEERFVRNIVKAHPELTILYAIYENAISNVSRRTRISRKPFY